MKFEARQKAAKSFAKKNNAAGDQGILHGDMGLLWDRLDDNSVDLFLTDPPYMDFSLYERLSELAAAKLKPGGLCLAYCGQMFLPKTMDALGKHLATEKDKATVLIARKRLAEMATTES